MIILLLCLPISMKGKVTELPLFVPNEYLFKTHADKGKEKWEIVAWAVRDIMAKTGNFTKCDNDAKNMCEYIQQLFPRKRKITID